MEKENIISIWLCNFPNEDTLFEYIEESYDDEGDVFSSFMNDFGIDFIDNQFMESFYFGEPVSRSLLTPFSYSNTFIHKLDDSLLGGYNAVIFAYDFEYSGGAEGKGNVNFIGAFSFAKD